PERGARAGLDGAERDAQELGDLGLRKAAPVRELDHAALVLAQLLERAVDAPGGPAGLGLLERPGFLRRFLRDLGRRLGARAAAVGDRVARDRIEPRSARTALRLVAARGAPDRGERLLHRVLGAAAVAEPAQGEPEDRSRVAA